jgi:hypothetical protein
MALPGPRPLASWTPRASGRMRGPVAAVADNGRGVGTRGAPAICVLSAPLSTPTTLGHGSPLYQEGGCSRLASVRRSSPSSSRGRLTAAAVRREREPPGATWRMGRRAGVRSQVAGPGSDFSEVPAQGRKPATLEPVAVPVCPPGPVAEARASLIICRQAWPGQPSLEAPDGFGAGLAGGELAAVAGAAFGVVAQLHDGHDVQHPVDAPVPGP